MSICQGIENSTLHDKLEIYPNPANGEFIIKVTQQGNFYLKLVNSLGQELLTERNIQYTRTYEKHFDLSEYAVGVYVLQLITDDGVITRQIIIE